MHNALVDAINETKSFHLARYVVIVLDADLIINAKVYDFGVSHTFEDLLKWLLININRTIELRKDDLLKKRPGAVSTTSEPRLVWTLMVKRPESANKHIFALTRKFNQIMENVVAGDKRSHVLTPEVPTDNRHFDRFGNLTAIGHETFWKSIDSIMKDFDHGETELVPNGQQDHQNEDRDRTQTQHNYNQNRYKWYNPDNNRCYY